MSARVQQRTRGSKWIKIRTRILRRDPVCVLCAEQDVVRESVVVDHITPLEHGGTDADDNLRGLCADHHDEVTRQQFGHRERRKAFGPDGLPIDGSWS
ncbi:HNH endonuclease [Burkholderia pseudomallei]|uniref:HNH endonuclease n=1 Tax=Burkholderia pseudomallei TaxID=28450 RepID=UPI000A1A108E|nr:HNH endonuclease signature motif containing protein [Burkholderia pseudomallei]ARK98304.1 HNH endonuclease [Burkholderia pseudomallei]